MKRVIVVGTLHESQKVGALSSLEKRLNYSVENRYATVIIEEWTVGDDATVGKRVADAHSLAWCNAGTPNKESMQTYSPGPIWIGDECLDYRGYGPIASQIEREAHMIDKISSAMTDSEVGLFVCGLAHLHSISEKLHLAGYEVEGYSCLE